MSREELRGILHEASAHGFIETWMEDLPRERAAAPGSP
jgi:hypothetical protein